PPAAPPLQPVEETRTRGHVHRKPLDPLAHQDHNAGLGDCTLAGDAHHRRKDQVLAGAAALALLDELLERAAKPGHRNLALRMEGRKQLGPAALVAIEAPGLDQLGARVFVFQTHDIPAHRCFLDREASYATCSPPPAQRRLVASYCGTMPAFFARSMLAAIAPMRRAAIMKVTPA